MAFKGVMMVVVLCTDYYTDWNVQRIILAGNTPSIFVFLPKLLQQEVGYMILVASGLRLSQLLTQSSLQVHPVTLGIPCAGHPQASICHHLSVECASMSPISSALS